MKIILAEPADFRHVLAITFTNKAAGEMKERVLKALVELKDAGGDAGSVSSTLLAILTEETGMSPAEISVNAARALEMILHNYADFAIGTIDSFSHRLIRTFAHDFGLPVNFNVELDADELLKTSVDLLLDRVGDDEALTGLLVKFLETRMDEDKGWKIGSILTGFAGILLDEEGQNRIGRLMGISLENFRKITDDLYERIRQFENLARDIATEGVSLLIGGGFSAADFYRGERGIWNYFANIAAGRMDKLEPNSYVVTTVEEEKWHSAKASSQARAEILSVVPALADIYRRLQYEIERHKAEYSLRKLLAKTIYPLAVLSEIEKVLNDFKRQNNIVHISEFNSRIAGIVMNEPVPFIYERLGERYRHILIDEFQDTSALQWMNFIPLIENTLAGGFFNLVVGDGKQAIYRWRGGDVEQFNALPAIPGSGRNDLLKQRQEVLEQHYVKRHLDRNFRSRSEIVDFNNRFFRTIADQVLREGKEKIFEGLEQHYDQQNTGGCISLEFITGDDDGQDFQSATLERVMAVIAEARQENFNLRDMAILCRSNKNASTIARHLLENGVDVVSAESLLVSNSPAVRFLIAYLRFLFEPRNDVVMAEIRQFLEREKGVTTHAKETVRNGFTALPVYDLCETLIRLFRLNDAQDPYLRFFLDAVLKFTTKKSTGPLEFLEWWATNKGKLSIIVPEELDAVRVMTIHKAKGLEFPLVILPFAVETRKNTREFLWVDLEKSIAPGLDSAILKSDRAMESTVYRDLYVDEQQKSMLDLLSILYVSMTRATDRLYVLTRFPPKKQDEAISLPAFFRHFLVLENIWHDDQRLYLFGSKTSFSGKSSREEKETLLPRDVISTDWRNKTEIRLRAPEMWDVDDPAGNSQRGSRLHTLLSWIITGDDIPGALKKASLSGLTDINESETIENMIHSVTSHPLLEPLFSCEVRVKTEPEILLPEGSFYRPDRVVFEAERVTVLDYKSGKPLVKHREQLIRYAGCMEEMGYLNIRRLLVYINPEVSVIEV